MTPLATLVIVWAAVYGYVCVYYCLLYARRRSDREYLTFGLLAGAMSIYSAGNAAFLQSETTAQSATAMRVTWLGVLAGVAFFVDFCHDLIDRPSRIRLLGYGWAAGGFAAIMLGLFVDEHTALPPADWGFAAAPDYLEAAVTPLGQLYLLLAFGFTSVALGRLVRVASHDADVRLLLISAALTVAAAGHDSLVRLGWLRSIYLLEHATMLAILAMCYVLLDRFVRTNDELRIRTEELSRSYGELKRTQRALVRKEQLAAMGELSATIAHEVRNPIAIIKNAISGLRRRALDDDDRETLVSIVDEETDRLHRLVNDLLAYARPVHPDGQGIELEALVRGGIEDGFADARAGDVEVDVDLSKGPARMRGDGVLLRQSIANLVDNALQAMPNGGRLSVRAAVATHEEGPAIALEIEDSGEGMDILVRGKARDPFFTTRAAGTGLGLSIVERVVQAHAGRLEIDSRHGRGTTVRLTLPVREERNDAAPPSTPGAQPTGNRPEPS